MYPPERSPYDWVATEQEAIIRECDDPANPGHPDGLRARRANAMAALTHLRILESGRTDPMRVADLLKNLYRLIRGSVWKLPAGTLLNFLLGDFRSMWEVLAINEDERPRGNFAFGLLAMTLLELACRACHGNDQALQEFAEALDAREPRYFWRLPKPFGGQIGGMTLATVRGVPPEEQLLCALFDMVRNGQAHLYQQTFVQLTDGGFAVSLTGAPKGAFLEHADAPAARQDHLSIDFDIGEHVLVLKVRVDVLFCDLRHAIQKTRLVERDLSVAHFQRKYGVSIDDLRASFAAMNGPVK